MLKTFLRRLLQIIPTLLVVVTFTFIITRMIPGDPAASVLGPQASVEDIEKKSEELGLNDSTWTQYKNYLGNIAKGDFGNSYSHNQPVTRLILNRLPNTLLLSLTSIVLAILIAIPIGIISAIKQYSIFDYTSMSLALVGVSMPIFWLGLMLVLVFSVNLGWLPSIGMGSIENGLWDVVRHMILPVICLTTIPTATFARITRSSMLDVINAEYIKNLRANGIKENLIIYKHALKNALPPIITVLGMQLAGSFVGAIVTETVFSWPGIGTLIVDAIQNRDYMLVQGAVLLTSSGFVFINLLVDIVYMRINPKVDYES